jgi:hypothetical protein
MVWDTIRKLEKIGYFVTEKYELFVEESKFTFRNIENGKRYSIEYNLKENFDDREYTQDEINDMKLCICYAKKLGFDI